MNNMEINKIYCGDAYKLIKEIPDHSIDLIYTDIPYLCDVGKVGGFLNTPSRNKLYKKELAPITQGIDYSILEEFCRVCKKIYCYIWCSKEQILPIGTFFKNKGCSFNILVWCKTNCTPFVNNSFLPDIEYCIVVREKGTHLNNDIRNKSKWYVSSTNVGDKKDYGHPTIKPLNLVERHLLHSSNEGDLILDAFIGSGTTAVACKHLKRNYIGFEIDEKYYKIACDRLNGITVNGEMDLFETDFDKVQEKEN